MDSNDDHIALEPSGGVSMDEHETVYSKLSFFKKSRWKGLLAIVVATGLIFEFATFGLSVHCELKPKTEHYLDFLTRSNEAGTEAPKINVFQTIFIHTYHPVNHIDRFVNIKHSIGCLKHPTKL